MKILKASAAALMVMIMATFGVMAANNGSISDSADFVIGNAYNIEVYNETTLEFPGDSEVGNVDSTGQFETTDLEIYLQHNYDVQVIAEGSAFDLDLSNSDYSNDYAIAAEWFFEWAEEIYPQGIGAWGQEVSQSVSDYDTTISETFDAEMDSSEGDVYGRISVKATRSALDDPQGTYEANLDDPSDLS